MTESVEMSVFLRQAHLVDDVASDDLTSIAQFLRERTLRKGHNLFREGGECGGEVFLVRQGTLVVSKAVKRLNPQRRVDQVVARVGPGQVVVEASLFDRLRRSSTATAETDVRLLVLERQDLSRLTEENPRAAAAFLHVLLRSFSEQLRATSGLVGEVMR